MRVLYICNEYPPAIHGGIGVFVRALAERLAAERHDVAVVGLASHVRENRHANENGVRIVRLPWPRSRAAERPGRFRIDSAALASRKMLSREAAKFAAEFRPDVVESHDWSGPLWTPPWRPLIVRLHGASSVHSWLTGKKTSRLLRFFERRNLLLADAIVSPSHFIGRATCEALRLRDKPAQILHHGIDVATFRPRELLRDPHEVLFAGTVKKQKGILELFQAAPRILERFPEARFTIAGRYPEDPGRPCSPTTLLQSLALRRAPGTAPVRFLGHVPPSDLAALYARAAVAVFPSRGEAFGLACAEAMACGAAVVMTARGSGPELIENGKSGLLVEPTDIGALASAVVSLLSNPPLRRYLGAAARARIVEKFDLRDAAARNVAFYEQVARRFPAEQHVHV
jgi:glycosyltransferase involved in cell wall biosynthesis